MKKVFFLLCCFVLFAILMSCNIVNNNNPLENDSISLSKSLEGIWVSKCHDFGNSAYSQKSITFLGDVYSEVIVNYTDSSCSVLKDKSQNSGVFSIGNALTTSSGIKASEFNITRYKKEGMDVNESRYTIFRIIDSNLYFGEIENNVFVNTIEARPLDLEFSNYFVKSSEIGTLEPKSPQETKSSGEIVFDGSMPELAKKSGCTACHGLERIVVGPAWIDIALRYSDDSLISREALIKKVKVGGKGSWTELTKGVPMPPYSPRVADEDIAALIDFILILDETGLESTKPVEPNAEMQLVAKQSGCFACHAIDKKVVGPSWADVAARYADDSVASREALIAKVKSGGKGNWTEVTKGVPMPPYSPRVTDENIADLVDFILGLDN